MKFIYLKALVGLYLFIFLSSLLQSCCNEETSYTGAGEMIAYYNENEGYGIDTINQEFHIRTIFDQVWTTAANYSLMDHAYATSCVYNELNNVVFSTLELSTVQRFVYKGDTLPIGYNLFELPTIDTIQGHWSPDQMEITFRQEFIDSSAFINPSLTFILTGETTNNLPIRIQKEIWINK